MKPSIRLVAESVPSGLYVFAYEKPHKNGFTLGFVYRNNKDGEFRYRDRSIGSIGNHNPWLFDHEPTTVFTPEELERIAALPVYDPSSKE